MGVGGSYQYGKTEIVDFLLNHLPKHAKILDMGAGGGTYGYYFQDKGCVLDAVELWPESIEQLKNLGWYRKVYNSDIRTFKYPKAQYDLIIFGDVLEHLTIEDAQKVLEQAKLHTKSIMIAVPYLYEQGAFYGNEAERHLQPDLTPSRFNERYPGYDLIIGNTEYGYYYKDFTDKNQKSFKGDKIMKNKICIYAICKNESQFVEKWLDSMSEADYIVVLDTGSTDDTVEKLKADPRVTRVEVKEIKPWRFDVARNESMKLIPDDANILMCTDFDEWLEPGWGDVLRSVWQPNTTRVHYTYAWSHTADGTPTDIFAYDKIHNRDYYWKFPVHEVLWRDDGENENCIDVGDSIYLHHFQDKSKQRGSYFDLLKVSVEEYPNDSHVRMLFAREYLLRNDIDNALTEYLNVLKMPDVEAPEKRLVLLESLGRCADLYMYQNNYDEAIWYAQEFIKEDYTYREPYLTLAKIYNQMNMFTLAEAMVNQALKYSTKKNTWVERADTWTYLPDDQMGIACYNLGRYDEALEHGERALKYFPDDANLLKNENTYLRKRLEINENKLYQE